MHAEMITKNFCTQYAIYPDMNGELHKPEELKKKEKVNDELFYFYQQVLGEDLKSKCVDECFESYYANYARRCLQIHSTVCSQRNTK